MHSKIQGDTSFQYHQQSHGAVFGDTNTKACNWRYQYVSENPKRIPIKAF